MTKYVKGGARLCGSGRKAGEVYLESALGAGGGAVENFLVDVPLALDAQAWGISPLGVSTFVDEHGVKHVLDWVGATHYPEVVDFIEEARVSGVSRKVSHMAPIQGLSPASRLWLLHPRAVLVNAGALDAPAGFSCPCGKGHALTEGCIGHAWYAAANVGPGERKLAEGKRYRVKSPSVPEKATFGLGVFMTLPVTNLSVIRSPDTVTLEARLAWAESVGVNVLLADE